MDASLAESRDRLRQALDDEIKSWQESTRALRSRRNTLAPISRLSSETLAAIFSYLPSCKWYKEFAYYRPKYTPRQEKEMQKWRNFSLQRQATEPDRLAQDLPWIVVTHVCRRWREIALNHPGLWSRINFTKLTPACMAEMLTRAKMAPLRLEADVRYTKWSEAKFNLFETQLEAHISHIRHLEICGLRPSTLERLVSPAPLLESLSLSKSVSSSQFIIPVNLLNYTAPSLTSLKLDGCDISWKSPLLKCLQTLEIIMLSPEARPKLEVWLDALNEMPHLKTLILESASPVAPLAPLISEPSRTLTLPSLTKFNISASVQDCVLAFTHLILPALTWLCVDAESYESEGEDVRLLIPYISQNVHWMQSAEPLQSFMISGRRTRAQVFAWNMPDVDNMGANMSYGGLIPARLKFGAKSRNWLASVNTAILDTLLTLLPINSISTLTAKSTTGLSKEFWLTHISRWPLLERASLNPPVVKGFREMLAEDTPPSGPRLSSLTKLIINEVRLTALRTFDLQDMLIERVEQGVPLEVLDLTMCYGGNHAIKLLREVVVTVHKPHGDQRITDDPAFFNSNGGIEYSKEVDYCDAYPWYGCTGTESRSEGSDESYDFYSYL